MEQARKNIREAINAAQSPAVLCSFGKDSLLLLALAREVRPDINVIWYRESATPEIIQFARSVIREWRLNVYSYWPADVYLLSDGDNLSLVQEYSLGTASLPVISDLKVSEDCALTAFPLRTPQLFLPFDVLLTGYKDSDSHWVKGGAALFPPDCTVGKAKLIAPIRHLSDSDVRAALYELKIPYKELDDRVGLCAACMTQKSGTVYCPMRKTYIPVEQWDREQALTNFQQRFGLIG